MTANAVTRRMIVAAAAVATIGGLASASPASAAQVGQLCRSTATWPMLSRTSGDRIYTVNAGELVRIDGFSGADYYLAHTQGHSTGRFARVFIDQNSCRW